MKKLISRVYREYGMKTFFSLIVMLLIVSNTFAKGNNKLIDPKLKTNAQQWMQNQTVRFIENKGQMVNADNIPVPFVLFKTSGPGMDVYITEKGLSYVFVKMEKENHPDPSVSKDTGEENVNTEMAWINMHLKNAHIKKANIIKEGESAEHFNYFYPHCPDGIYDVKQYNKITIKDVYPGIDWVFYNSSNTGMKYDFIVRPGADPEQIKLIYESEKPLTIDRSGNINIKTQLGTLTENAPYSYLLETKSEVKNSFTKTIIDQHNVEVGFNFTSHISDITSTLVIDPQLVWSTFFGPNYYTGTLSIDTDANGNVFTSGYATASNPSFPVMNAGTFFQGSGATPGYNDCFVIKFTNTGVLLWCTYYGGNGNEAARSGKCDSFGNYFIVGETSSTNFPTQNPGGGAYFQSGMGVAYINAFIIKFNNSGTRLWATYYGDGSSTNNDDRFSGVTSDLAGSIYVTGFSTSPNFPTLNPGGGAYYQSALSGNNDVIIVKFSNMGSLLWATYYGSNFVGFGYTESAGSVACDNSGSIFILGQVSNTIFPTLNPGGGAYFQGSLAGSSDLFILKFNGMGTLLWSTYYGGSGDDYSSSIICDPSGNVFISGTTLSTNFPVLNSGTFFQGGIGGARSAVFIKFNNNGNRLWATYFGTGASSDSDNIAIDKCGAVYFSMSVSSSGSPTVNSGCGSFFDASWNSFEDIFLTKFTNNGTLVWSTYYGGNGGDFREALAVDNNDNLFVTGEWKVQSSTSVASSYPLVNPGGGAYFRNTFSTGGSIHDLYFAKFIPITASYTQSQINATSCVPCNGSATINLTCSEPNYSYSWSTGSSTLNSTSNSNTINGLCPGSYTVTATSSCNQTQTATFTITGTVCGGITANVNSATLCSGATPCPTLTATGANGTAPYTYLWSTSATTASINPCPVNTTTYTVTVTDNAGLTVTTTATATVNPAVNVTTTSTGISCNGGTNGSAIATPNNGTLPYTYAWSNGGATFQISNLMSQTYSVTVTDSKGCTGVSTTTITTPPPLIGQFTKGKANCTGCGCKEWIMATAMGGTSPYSYSWPGGYDRRYLNQLCPGTYTVNIKDKNGCSVNVIVSTP